MRKRRTASPSPSTPAYKPARDLTAELPDDILAIIFDSDSLSLADLHRCSAVCRRWNNLDGITRSLLYLRAYADLLNSAPSLFSRYGKSLTALSLHCDRFVPSIGDESIARISLSCPNLSELALVACTDITHAGMAALAHNLPCLRSLYLYHCRFGARGLNAVLFQCRLIKALTISHIQGINDEPVAHGSPSLRSLRAEGARADNLAGLIGCSPNLASLELGQSITNIDNLFDILYMTDSIPRDLLEIRLDGEMIGDPTMLCISACENLESLTIGAVNSCTDAGLACVANNCRHLREVTINGDGMCMITPESVVNLLRCCPDLRELELSWLDMGVVRDFDCSGLESLEIFGGKGEFGDEEIASIAARCKSLRRLSITMAQITDEGIMALAQGCPNLVSVEVRCCEGVTPKTREWLRANWG